MSLIQSNMQLTACLQRRRRFWVTPAPRNHPEAPQSSNQVHTPFKCGQAVPRHLRGSLLCPCGCWGCFAAQRGSLAG